MNTIRARIQGFKGDSMVKKTRKPPVFCSKKVRVCQIRSVDWLLVEVQKKALSRSLIKLVSSVLE